jgi:hypothetical protein
MIDERFSVEAFEKAAYDSEWLRCLLRDEIVKEIDEVLKATMLDIIRQMNSLGHRLTICNSPPGSIIFKDLLANKKSCDYDYKIIIGADITVTLDIRL